MKCTTNTGDYKYLNFFKKKRSFFWLFNSISPAPFRIILQHTPVIENNTFKMNTIKHFKWMSNHESSTYFCTIFIVPLWTTSMQLSCQLNLTLSYETLWYSGRRKWCGTFPYNAINYCNQLGGQRRNLQVISHFNWHPRRLTPDEFLKSTI